jgi:5-methyltetrahydropteroyltriglutamate--homocysteine methyltransferase
MRHSDNRILTSHAGSLPRPDELIEANRAFYEDKSIDEARFNAVLGGAVGDVVRRQNETGIDVPGDGEFGKAMAQRVNYGSWWRYSSLRFGGLAAGGLTLYEQK